MEWDKATNLANNFLTVSSRVLIFHMGIPCDKIIPWVPLCPVTLTLTLEFDPFTLLITFEQ